LIPSKFVVADKITAYNGLVMYYRKLAYVQDEVWGVVYICYACVVDLYGVPFSAGSFYGDGHIREPGRVMDRSDYNGLSC